MNMIIRLTGFYPPFDRARTLPIDVDGDNYRVVGWRFNGYCTEWECITEKEYSKLADERTQEIIKML